jgi:hypothetical protein
MSTLALLFWPGVAAETIMASFPQEPEEFIFYEKTKVFHLWYVHVSSEHDLPSPAHCIWMLQHLPCFVRISVQEGEYSAQKSTLPRDIQEGLAGALRRT